MWLIRHLFQNQIKVATILKGATIENHIAVLVNAEFQDQTRVTTTIYLTITIKMVISIAEFLKHQN